MKTVYLVDFENVFSSGLDGCEELGMEDQVIIFYTSHANRLDLDIISGLGDAKLSAVRAKVGHQSADMLIASYLGHMLSENKGEDISYRIISKDSDYDSMIEFWSEREDADITRFDSIKLATGMNQVESSDLDDLIYFEEAESTVSVVCPTSEERSELNRSIMHALGGYGFSPYAVGFCASTAVHTLGMSNYKQRVYREYISEFGMADGLKYYNLVKPYL